MERPPFTYVGGRAYQVWSVETPAEDEEDGDEFWFDLALEDRSPYGLITTQTCDLYEDRPSPRQPWITVAPAYDAEGLVEAGQVGQLDRGRIGHLVRLTGPTLPSGIWVGDLRIEVPIEKGWLVGRTPIEAFATEPEYGVLSERLAHRKQRPAVATAVLETVVRPLEAWLRGTGRPFADGIDSLRLEVSGSPLAPTAARILVMGDRDPVQADVRAAIEEWWAEAAANASATGLGLFPCLFSTLDDLSARQYAESVRLDFDYLSPEV